jgi:hypothetical protein
MENNEQPYVLQQGGSGPDGLQIIGGVVMVRNPDDESDYRLVSTSNLQD